jgi:two-component system CheB/CheR fusion protein
MVKKSSAGKKKAAKKSKSKAASSFPIVAIGASAGGLEAVSQLLKHLSPDTGMVFFYIQHLSPDHPSNLALLLSRSTKMEVHEVRHGLKIEKNAVYVCTPNQDMSLEKGKIKLAPRPTESKLYLPINTFFNSLAVEYKEKVIGIILSGNATDGVEGLSKIKEEGGITFAQDDTAKNHSMPRSAIEAGAVDSVMAPREMAEELARLGKTGLEKHLAPRMTTGNNVQDSDKLKIIFDVLQKKTGNDFSHYKMNTIKRRLNFRMLHSGVRSLKEYVALLLKKNDEADLLCKDLLINVTSFFRDPEAFRYLKTTFFPKLLGRISTGGTVRIWVPACSTGEEAYSIAMILTELQDKLPKKIAIRIFATDISDQALADARLGEYSELEVKNIAKARLKKFFIRTGDGYRVIKELREMCVFAPHNILHDPPFSRMDFISCCNLLIYFDSAAQKKALTTFNFALSDGGYLMLGKSETIGSSSQFLKQVNNKFKIYCKKKNSVLKKIPDLLPRHPKSIPIEKHTRLSGKKPANDTKELDNVIDLVLLSSYMPACAIINKDMEIIKFRGSTSLYLSHSSGNASLNIMKLIRPDFAFELRGAIQKALKSKQTVHKPNLEIEIHSVLWRMSLDVCPLKVEWEEPLLLIVFRLHEKVQEDLGDNKGGRSNANRKIKSLTEKLNNTRVEMQSVIESQEEAYEKLQAASEEIVSANEEFQTLNEELETSKEEIEATNEELISTNQELQMRNDLLTESYRYSEGIIATIHEPMLILDSNFHVKTANRAFYKKFLVSKEDTESLSLFELGDGHWDIPELRKLLEEIVEQNVDFKNLEITHVFPNIGKKIMLLNAHRIIQKVHRERLILLAIEDITERTLHYQKEKEILHKDILAHKADKAELEQAVRRRTRQLEKKNLELENANKDLTAFTYVSSHDLQEPLRKIRNFATVLLREEEKRLSKDGKKYLQRTYETAKRMQLLIEDLLKYSRTRNIDRKPESTDLNSILNEAKQDLEDLIASKKAVIRAGRLGEAKIIPFQFRQLFHNLIGNSLKFSGTRQSPLITLKSEKIKGDKSGIKGLSPKAEYIHIIYTDNGIGFEPEYNERVFQVFQRLHNPEEYQGTGMGLAICKRIVENHNGLITANGKLHKGVTFDIYIPVDHN